MFDKITYKQKNYGLLAIFLLLAIVSYKRSFVLSISTAREIKQQEIQKTGIHKSTERLSVLTSEINRMNSSLGKTDQTSDKVRQELLKEISRLQQHLSIRIEFISNPHLFTSVDYKILTHEVLLEGNYRGLIKGINNLENRFIYARIINAKIFKTKAHGETKSKVYAKLLFQHYYKM